MAYNIPIILRYGGNIVEGPDGSNYDGPQPSVIPPNPHMNFNVLCSEIYRITNWPINFNLIINARLPLATGDRTTFLTTPITNDTELISVCTYIFSEHNSTWRIVEIYVEYEDPTPVDNVDPIPDVVNQTDEFDRARVSNNLNSKINDEEDEPNLWDYNDIDESGMGNVGTFGNPPALEFEDISMTENAKTDMELGLAVYKDDSCVDLKIGQTFKTKTDLTGAVNLYCIVRHREILVDHSRTTIYTVTCRFKNTQNCEWRLHASINKSGLFEVKKLTNIHRCVNPSSGMDNKQLSSAFIAGIILDLIRKDLGTKPSAIIETVKLTHKYTISYPKAWQAKQKAIKYLFGSWKGAYATLPRLMTAITQKNPGSQYKFWFGPPNAQNECEFEGLFWAFGPAIHGFQYCRPVITVDATFLTGKYKGCLLLAVASDANNHLFPIAYAIVEKETNDTWGWFFMCLSHIIRNRSGLTVISDRHAGIIRAMNNEWAEPRGYHRWCMRHFCANFHTNIKDKNTLPRVQSLCMQHSELKFNNELELLKKKNERAVTWLMSRDKAKWAVAYDEGGRRWGILTSNNAEVMNSVFKGMRSLPVTAIVLQTFYKCNSYMVAFRKAAASAELAGKVWVDRIMDILEVKRAKGQTFKVEEFDLEQGIYEVTSNFRRLTSGRMKGGNMHEVHLNTCECSCMKPQLYHYPCTHMIAVCSSVNYDFRNCISKYYSVENLVGTYASKFVPIRDNRTWPEYNGPILYPGEKLIRKNAKGKTKRGKRQTKRLHMDMDTMEIDDRRNKCGICKQKGHRRTTCARRGEGSGM